MNLSTKPTVDESYDIAATDHAATRRFLSLLVSVFSIAVVIAFFAVLTRATNSVSVSASRTQMYTALAANNLPDIETYARHVLAAEPLDADAYQALVWSLAASGQLEAARATVREFLLASGGIVGYTLDALAKVADSGRLTPALDLTTYLIAEIEVGTGFSGRTQQNTRNSLGRLQDTGLYNAYSARGHLYARMGETAAAITDYRAAIAALPNHFFGYEQLIHYQFQQNDFEGAVETLNDGERHGALSQLFYVRVAEQYFFTGRPTAWVLTLLDLSHRYDNIAYFGWFVEGCVYRAEGNLTQARAAMREWKALRPDDPLTTDELLAACSNPESKLFWHVDPLFESGPNYYGMDG